jgi:hypothetical protein
MINKTICCIDTGVFQAWAHRLARDYDRVLYYRPDPPKPVSSLDDAVGSGFDDIERIYDPWAILDEIDTFFFCHVQWGNWASYLRSIGKRVWSSFYGEEIELLRENTKEVLLEVGLPVIPYEVVTGIDDLRQYLEDHSEQVVKVSRVRGLVETFPARSPIIVEMKLDKLQADLGPLKKTQEFLVEEAIEAITEDGYDGYCIRGKFPKNAFWGTEIKNHAYAGKYELAAAMPKSIRLTNEKLAPTLAQYGYAGFWHTEIRETNKTFYPTDFTCRCASPAGEGIQELIANLGDIIEAGVDGEIEEPKSSAKYWVQAVIVGERADKKWIPFEIPDGIFRWVKLFATTKINGIIYSIPMFDDMDEVGYVIGTGPTIDAAIAKVNEYAEKIKNSEIKIRLSSLDEVKIEMVRAAA